MRFREGVLQAFFCFCILSTMVVPVLAQTSLTPNETLEEEQIIARSNYGGPKDYVVSLSAGHWTVIITRFLFSMPVNITVATDLGFSDIITVSGEGYGDFREADFTLSSSTTVYILVQENTLPGYDDDPGLVYNIGVYDDDHIATLTTTPTTTTTTDTIPEPESMLMLTIVMGIIVLTIVGAFLLRRRSKEGPTKEVRMPPTPPETFTVHAPEHVIPPEHRVRADGADIRTVRLPTKCPECGAVVSHETIDWVGPLEAACNYCGATVRAKFERI